MKHLWLGWLATALLAFGLQAADVSVSALSVAGRIGGENFDLTLDLTATAATRDAELRLIGSEAVLTDLPAGDGWFLRYDPARNGYYLVIAQPNRPCTVKLSLAAVSSRTAERHTWRQVLLNLPEAPIRQVAIDTDRPDLEVDLPNLLGLTREKKGESLHLAGYLRPGQPLGVRWKPQLTDVEAELLVACEVNTIVGIAPGTLRIDSLCRYTVSQGKLRELSFQVPPELTVTQVRGPDIRDWKLDAATGQLKVQLSRDQESRYSLQVLGERVLPQMPTEAGVPVIVPLGVTRADGSLAIGTDSAIQIGVTQATGLAQIDEAAFPRLPLDAEQPRPLPGGKAFYYAFAAAGYAVKLSLADIVPSFDMDSRLVVQVEDDDLTIAAELELDVRDAPIRRLVLSLPSGFAVAGVAGQQVGDHSSTVGQPGQPGQLTVDFLQPVIGKALVQVRLEMGKSPLGATIELQGIEAAAARNQRGFLAVAAAAGVLLDNPQATSLRQVHTRSIPLRVANAQYAWRFREAGWKLALPVKERPAAIRAEAFHLVLLGDGVSYGTVALTYYIAGAPIDELSFKASDNLDNIEFVGLDVSRWTREGDLYRVKLRRKVIGDYNLGVTYSQRYADGQEITAGAVEAAGVETQRGYLVVASHLNLRLVAGKTDQALIQINPDELPEQYRLLVAAPVLQSFKYVDIPHTAQLAVHLFERGATPQVLAEFVSATTTVSVSQDRDAESVTRVRYSIRNSSAQFLDLTVPPELDVWATRLIVRQPNGAETVQRLTSSRDGTTLKIPLHRQRNPNEPITIEVEYGRLHGRLPWSGHLDLAMPPTPVLVTYADWNVSAEKGWVLRAGPSGSMTADPQPLRRGIGGFMIALLKGWGGACTSGYGPIAVAIAVVLLLLALVLRRRWFSLAVLLLLSGGMALAGARALSLAMRTWGRSLPQAVSFSQVLNLEVRPLSVGVNVVPIWRQDFGLIGSLLLLAVAVAAWWWTRRSPRWHSLTIAAGIVALISLALQFREAGLVLLHLCTWALPLICFVTILVMGVVKGIWRARRLRGLAGWLILALLLAANRGEASPEPVPASPPAIPVDRVQARLDVAENSLIVTYDLTANATQAIQVTMAPASAIVLAGGDALLEAGGHWVLALPAGSSQTQVKLLLPLDPPSDQQVYRFQLPLPAALTNQVVLNLPRAGLAVTCPQAVRTDIKDVGQQTVATLIVRPGGTIDLAWQPRVRKATQEETVFYTDITSLARADSGLIETQHLLHLRISQGELARLKVNVPPEMTVIRVDGAGLDAWRFDPAAHTLEAHLGAPVTGDYDLIVVTQVTAASMPYTAVLRRLTVIDTVHQRGSLGLIGSQAVLVDVAGRPRPMNIEDFGRAAQLLYQRLGSATAPEVIQAYRQDEESDTVEVTVQAVSSELRVVEQASFSVADERLLFATGLVVDIAKAGRFTVDLELPEAYDIETLAGPQVSHWDELEEANGRRVRVYFRERLLGQAQLDLALSRSVTGLPEQVIVPRVSVVEALKLSGQLVVAVDRGVRLSVFERDGITELDVAQLGLREKPAIAFKLLRPEWRLTLRTEVLEPRVNVEFLHLAQVTDGLVRHSHFLRYQLHNAGSKFFTVKVPAEALGLLISGPDIARKEELEGQPGVWRVELTGKWYDQPYPLQLTYETRFDAEQGKVTILPVAPLETELQHGFLVVKSSSRVELTQTAASAALRIADARTVPTLFGAGDLADAAFCHAVNTSDYSIAFQAARHEAADLLAAEVLRTDLTTVVSRLGDALHRVHLELKAAGKRHLRTQLPANAQVWSLLVDRQSRTPSLTRDDQGHSILLIPLPQTAGGVVTAEVELTYVIPRPAKWSASRLRFDGPRFDLPLREIAWTLYVPEGYKYWDFGGTLRPDDATVTSEKVQDYSLDRYNLLNVGGWNEDVRKAVELKSQGLELAKKGEQKAARQLLQQAYNYSASDKGTNEDAQVSLRNLILQQAVVGLVSRRNDVRQEDQPGQQGAGVSLGANFTQEEAQRLQSSLSKPDSENLEKISNRMIEMQEAAADSALQLIVSLPERGRVLTFRKAIQVELNSDMHVAFKGWALPAWRRAESWAWALGLILVLAGILAGWAPAGRLCVAYHQRPVPPSAKAAAEEPAEEPTAADGEPVPADQPDTTKEEQP